MNMRFIGYAAAIFAALGAVNARATVTGLTAVTGGVNNDIMISDSVLDVTWADYTSVAVNIYPSYGIYATPYAGSAQEWLAGLNALSYGGYNDWRLATANGSGSDITYSTGAYASGFPNSNFQYSDCHSGSEDEFGCLFYNELGLSPYVQPTGFGPFTNLNTNTLYWSGARYDQYGGSWCGSVTSGPDYGGNPRPQGLFIRQCAGYAGIYSQVHAIAVRTGQTLEAPPPVTPIPATIWLLISSVGGMGAFARKRKGAMQ